VSTPADLATFKAWGANPTPIDWGQTYTALQQGVVDGLQLVPDIIAPAKIHEVVKYNLRLNYQMVVQLIFINGKTFAALSPEHQKVLMDAAEEAKLWQRNDGASRIAKVVDDLSKVHGMQVYEPTSAEYAQWASVREKVWEDVSAQLPGKVDLNLAKRLYESQ
jgi:TRAP-type C4-dicarboxylate transport system substrate-binding protein